MEEWSLLDRVKTEEKGDGGGREVVRVWLKMGEKVGGGGREVREGGSEVSWSLGRAGSVPGVEFQCGGTTFPQRPCKSRKPWRGDGEGIAGGGGDLGGGVVALGRGGDGGGGGWGRGRGGEGGSEISWRVGKAGGVILWVEAWRCKYCTPRRSRRTGPGELLT